MRSVEQPVSSLEGEGTAHERIVTRHPAFASIRAARVSGGAYLYGSEFQNQHYVVVGISASEEHRHLSSDWHHSEIRPLIEVAMTEDQWALFQSSLNREGVPCTLQEIQNVMVPGIPRPDSKSKQFAGEAEEAAKAAFENIEEMIRAIEAANIPAKTKKELIGHAHGVSQQLTSSMPFVLKQFAEHMEATVAKAKAAINAYASHTGMTMPTMLEEEKPKPKRITRSR